MNAIVRQLGQRVLGALSGFDRLLFRGFLRCVINPRGLNGYLYGAKVPMAKFGEHALEVTAQLIDESTRHARETGREIRYLESSDDRKKDIAEEIAHRDRIDSGLICVLKCVEPCTTLRVRGNRETKKIAIQRERGKCLHLYHYFIHPQFGFMHVRLQTWFPFTMQICLNGREWLARDLTTAGIGFRRHDNCIYRVDDLEAGQRLLDAQLAVSWPKLLGDLARLVHPAHEQIFANCPAHARDYYWTVAESEWASDILFRDPADVLPLCERLAVYNMSVHGPGDVMRFFGRTVRADGHPRTSFHGTIQSDVRLFDEGLRLKHWMNGNSLKMYNKPAVLRIETTINHPQEFKAFRVPENAPPDARPEWLRVRKGVADLYRRAEVSKSHRYRLTEKGRQGLTALLAAANASTSKLTSLASSLAA